MTVVNCDGTQETRVAIFLDRDGVLNVEAGDYITSPEDLEIIHGVPEAISKLTRAGLRVFVFTNQAGVGRGRFTADTLTAIHVKLVAELESVGGKVSGIYACPHKPEDSCDCRKPEPGMLYRAAREHNIDLTASYVVGDTPRDIAAGTTAGCETILVLTGHTRIYDSTSFPDPQPNAVFPSLLAAATAIVGTA